MNYEVPSTYGLTIATVAGPRRVVVSADRFVFENGRWLVNGEPVILVGYEVLEYGPAPVVSAGDDPMERKS